MTSTKVQFKQQSADGVLSPNIDGIHALSRRQNAVDAKQGAVLEQDISEPRDERDIRKKQVVPLEQCLVSISPRTLTLFRISEVVTYCGPQPTHSMRETFS